jgi:hypothetical protein
VAILASIILLMNVIAEYFERNRQKLEEIYQSSCKEGVIPATNLFLFLREVFAVGGLQFLRGKREYFGEDDHQSHTEQVIG